MKKYRIITSLIVVVVLGLISALAYNYFFTKETSYADRITFNDDEDMLAIFFLGGLEGSYDYSIVNKYFAENELKQFHTLELEGEECYLVVPRDDISVTVSSLSMTEDGGTKARKVTEYNEPFYIKCNVSDIFSNVELSFKYMDKLYSYSPYISLKDGSIVVEDFVTLVNE